LKFCFSCLFQEIILSSLEELWNLPNSVTADKLYRPRALMTRNQAVTMLAIAADKPKGMIPEEFLKEARKVLRGPLEA